MPRAARIAPGGMVFHVLNRGVGRMELFSKGKDYAAFEGLLEETCESRPMRICAYCLMPNHHFVVWPRQEGEVTAFSRWLAHTHAMRWHVAHGTVGRGHLHRGRCSIVREISVRRQVSGKALAAGIAANRVNQEPAARAVPLTYFSNDA